MRAALLSRAAVHARHDENALLQPDERPLELSPRETDRVMVGYFSR